MHLDAEIGEGWVRATLLSVEPLVSPYDVPLRLFLWGDVELGAGGDEEARLEEETMAGCL